jgi:hypothetical protein
MSIKNIDGELELKQRLVELEEDMRFIERCAVHHASKMKAENALSLIQHYPPIRAITKGYKDGVIPDTPNPYERIAELERNYADSQDMIVLGLKADIAELERKCQAQEMLIASIERQRTRLHKQQDEWREAKNTLDSERQANAELTSRVDELERQLEQSKNINKHLMATRDAIRSEAHRDALEKAASVAWCHYMDACKKYLVHPANYNEFSAASAIRATMDNEPAPTGWQPIETAPTDGTPILLFEKYSSCPFVGSYLPRAKCWTVSHEHVNAEGGWEGANVVDDICQELITHWMPLPPAPTELQGMWDASDLSGGETDCAIKQEQNK